MTDIFAPGSSEPVHRLFALIGKDAMAEWIEGAPSFTQGLALAVLDMPCHLHLAAVRIMHEAGGCNDLALAEPCEALQALATAMTDGTAP